MSQSLVDPSRWRRRFVSIGLRLVAVLVVLGVLPVWLPLALLVDGLSKRTYTRAGLFFLWYLLYSILGVGAAGLLWMVSCVPGGPTGASLAAWHHRLQHWWAGRLYSGLAALFGLRLEVEQVAEPSDDHPRPVVLLSRHVSTADTLLPLIAFAIPGRRTVRYVLKRELLWDPCLDIVGQRVPNAFVRRGGLDRAGDLAQVRRLADHLGPQDCIVLFPEGTRFTPERQQRVLDRLAKAGDDTRWTRARALRHVLPLRMGGLEALLDAAPATDLVWMSHVGLEGVTRMSSLVDGSLLGRSLRVVVHRVPAEQVPRDRDLRAVWLQDQWENVDRRVSLLLSDVPPDQP